MTRWKIATAAMLASLMFAAPGFAQGTTAAPATGTEAKGEAPKESHGTPDSTMKSSDRMKSPDRMKAAESGTSETMKSGVTKSGAMHASRKRGMAMGGGDEKVKAAQQALRDKGHDPGTVDGRMGPKTHAALRDFQKAQGIDASGDLDTRTMQALGVEVGKTSSVGESPTSGSASPPTSGAGGAPKSGDAKTSEDKK